MSDSHEPGYTGHLEDGTRVVHWLHRPFNESTRMACGLDALTRSGIRFSASLSEATCKRCLSSKVVLPEDEVSLLMAVPLRLPAMPEPWTPQAIGEFKEQMDRFFGFAPLTACPLTREESQDEQGTATAPEA